MGVNPEGREPTDGLQRARAAVPAWVVTTLGVFVACLVTVDLGRFLEWDEATFFSQSGDLDGSGSEPSVLVASREIGPPRLIGLLRLLGDGIAETRLLWMVLAIVLLVLGAWRLARACDAPGWLAAGLIGTFWLTQLFLGGFFGFAYGAALALCVLAAYVHLRTHGERQVRVGVLLGLAAAASLWMRHVESALVLGVVAAHTLVVTPVRFWRLRWRGVVAAVGTVTVAFAVPWIVDSTVRYGGVMERIGSGRGQDFERGFTNNLPEYLGVLRGRSAYYARVGSPPPWSLVALDLLWLLLVLALVVAVVRHRSRRPAAGTVEQPRVAAVGLCTAVAVTLVAFFTFFIGEVSDRYLLVGLGPALVVGSLALRRSVDGLTAARATAVLTTFVVVWGAVNTVVGVQYEDGRAAGGAVTRRTSETVRVLRQGAPCLGTSRYGAPPIQLASGCDIRSGSGAFGDALTDLSARGDGDQFLFLLWPSDEIGAQDVPPGWERVERPSPNGVDLALIYRSPS